MRISVLDTGVDRNHPALAHNIKASLNIISGAGESEDGSGHGTYVAGIIAADNKGEEKVSVAPEANLYCLKVLEDDTTGKPSDLIAGIEWSIENGMQIINMSLGLSYDLLSVREALRQAENSGMLVVAAAGNEGHTNGAVAFPGAYDFVVAVTAIDRLDRFSPRSSWGPQVDLCAPGDEINSTDRYSHLPEWVRGALPHGNYHIWPTGPWTSFAAPHVTGVAALVLSVNRSIASDRLRQILRDTAENLGLPATQQGAGVVNAVAATEQAKKLTV